MDRRTYTRKILDPIHVVDIHAVDRMIDVARYGKIVNTSATGMLIEVRCTDLSPELAQRHLSLEAIEGDTVTMKIVEMELHIDGKIARACYTADAERCDIAVDLTDHAPTFWRECLAELLPSLGEMEQDELC